jgi:hypothetical protein
MTAATTAKRTIEKNKELKSEKAIDKKGTTGPTLRRLTGKMAGGEGKGKFILGLILRLIALIALVLLPFITGQAMNVINEGGTTDELLNWVIYGAIAGVIFLVLSFFADRTFCRSHILQPGDESTLQTADGSVQESTDFVNGVLLQDTCGRALEPGNKRC